VSKNKENNPMNRRTFIKDSLAQGATLALLGGSIPVFTNGLPSEKITIAAIGVNSRGGAVAKNFARQENCEVAYICDVDSRAAEKSASEIEAIQKKRPQILKDFRKALEDKSLDAVLIATPDHWHAPASILACAAGKHVYVEKPCSHNPREGELLIKAARKYKRLVQMGNQRRSWPNLIKCMEEVKNGVIGKVYFAKGWYANNRKPIGHGKVAPTPDWLDYELWQGPAPRRPFQDNLIHYNWHWFWNWGTGESLNNGTHEIDCIRWALGVDYPIRVASLGGRYHYDDDWETPDTQVITVDFPGGKSFTWEGRSCNKFTEINAGRGFTLYGTNGSILTKGNNGYEVYDIDNKLVKEVKETANKEEAPTDKTNTVGPGDRLDAIHVVNFLESIREKAKLTAEIEEGHKSTLLCQLGNIAYRTKRVLNCDPTNGRILKDKEAMKLWSREYARGWEPVV
jgi:predicted dehydrogenase